MSKRLRTTDLGLHQPPLTPNKETNFLQTYTAHSDSKKIHPKYQVACGSCKICKECIIVLILYTFRDVISCLPTPISVFSLSGTTQLLP